MEFYRSVIVLEHQYGLTLIFKRSIKCNICRLRENRHQFISFPPECKARNIQTLVSIIKEHHALLISQTIMKDERCCSS